MSLRENEEKSSTFDEVRVKDYWGREKGEKLCGSRASKGRIEERSVSVN